ncbi:Anti-sigma regulatory factor (Ser/Thr protein kinase) [Geodermatophilus telluris]|uniref:Anti-sigma regulatory factor (Ser/Thr protein kinase) n=1 Tax=Geodermatophilus telluris TaxID=1190417 RepID=A0A1G6UI76_9ACTN|nr:sensor histidine kinase [Geodermatophilus telluris]SDD40277.1 Anti-sigma regulatory factor (Ser/Thr protein kinase) [Geodermatophilus telluris]
MDPLAGASATQAEPGRSRASVGQPPPAFSHAAAAVQSADELVAVAAACVEEGLQQGDLPVLALAPEVAAAVRRALGAGAAAVEADERIAMRGVRAPDALVVVRRFLEQARSSRSGRLRVVAEPQWGTDPLRWREVRRFESMSNALMARAPVTALCVYDRGRLPADVVAAARHTHPELIMGGIRVASSGYHQPEQYLRELAAVREPVEDGRPVLVVDGAPTLPALRGALRQVLADLVPDEDRRADLHLALAEVAANAFRHGRQPVSARVWTDGARMVCTITDSGTGFDDPLAGFVPAHGDDLAAGGMGLWLARKLWDSVDLRRGPHGLTVRLSTRLGDPPGRSSAA